MCGRCRKMSSRRHLGVGFFVVNLVDMLKYLDDILLIIGAVLICIGTYAVCPIATWFMAGIFCIIGGVVYGKYQVVSQEDK